MGRKRYFKTPEDMQAAIDAYFEDCKGEILKDDQGNIIYNKYGEPVYIDVKPLTVTGLALALGFTSLRALLDYQDRKDFTAVVEKAKLKIENYAEMRLYDKDGWNGARFNLQNNFKNWDADKSAQDDKKGPAINIICDIPRIKDQTQDEDIGGGFSLDPESVDRAIKELEQDG